MTNSTVIANALCFIEGTDKAPNVGGDATISIQELYLRNSFVSLWSVRQFAPDCNALLVTNTNLPDLWQQRFTAAGIQISMVPFDQFVLPPAYNWRLAYYKLCAAEYLAKNYQRIMLLDADAFLVSPLSDLWAESAGNLFLYDTQHRFQHPFRSEIRYFSERWFGLELNPIHIGGELVLGDSPIMAAYLAQCRRVFTALTNDLTEYTPARDQSDETVWSIAAELGAVAGDFRVRFLNSYLYRYWTSDGFNLVSTNYKYNPVSIWHFPLEKRDGILALYNYIAEHNQLPPAQTMYYMLHLEKTETRLLKDMVLKRLRKWGLWKK